MVFHIQWDRLSDWCSLNEETAVPAGAVPNSNATSISINLDVLSVIYPVLSLIRSTGRFVRFLPEWLIVTVSRIGA
jgi:hypothetical protein